jgi:hypothetical protein
LAIIWSKMLFAGMSVAAVPLLIGRRRLKMRVHALEQRLALTAMKPQEANRRSGLPTGQ